MALEQGHSASSSDKMQGLAIPTKDVAELGVAKARRIPQHGGEHRLKIAGGTADYLKDL
jgi:hypothetical protein